MEARFDWQRQGAAEQLCLDLLAGCRRESSTLARLEAKLQEEGSGRLLAFVDHLRVRDSTQLRTALSASGFVRQPDTAQEAFYHPGAVLPRLILLGAFGAQGVALRVESIADFLQVHRFAAEIEGGAFSSFRRTMVASDSGVEVLAVERRGSSGFDPVTPPAGYLQDYFSCLEFWRNRPRGGEEEETALAEALRRAARISSILGPDLAAHIVCQGERSYWLARNFAGRLQKSRQDALGFGWANHDHHTFRSSRRHFAPLVELFSTLGFHCRERFYAGDEAGWGAQLMENPSAGLTLFLDVDLAPEEVAADFAREKLPEREQLGTVGLWCALHGDSILDAGMHHLAAQFDFDRLVRDLGRHGIDYMPPFSNFSYLRQAFSAAERWPVEPQRLAGLIRQKSLSEEQGEKFLAQGAIGSHLENIERREGYKGFNKKNVSVIIRATDPRK